MPQPEALCGGGALRSSTSQLAGAHSLTHAVAWAGVVLKDGGDLSADLVVDCSGRNSSMPKWLEAAGFHAPPQTVVDSGLGASGGQNPCIYAVTAVAKGTGT